MKTEIELMTDDGREKEIDQKNARCLILSF